MKSYNSPQKCNCILCFRYANSVEEACSALVSFTHMKLLRSTYVKSLSNYVYHKKKILRNDVIEYWVNHGIEFLPFFTFYYLDSSSFYSVLLYVIVERCFRKNLSSKNVDYILSYIKNDNDGSYNRNDEKMDKILDLWIDHGGSVGSFNITRDLNAEMYLKYSALEYNYEWIILLHPRGIPVSHLDELFHLYDSNVTKVRNVTYKSYKSYKKCFT